MVSTRECIQVEAYIQPEVATTPLGDEPASPANSIRCSSMRIRTARRWTRWNSLSTAAPSVSAPRLSGTLTHERSRVRRRTLTIATSARRSTRSPPIQTDAPSTDARTFQIIADSVPLHPSPPWTRRSMAKPSPRRLRSSARPPRRSSISGSGPAPADAIRPAHGSSAPLPLPGRRVSNWASSIRPYC